VRLLRSMGHIFVSTEVLRRRALYHACMFGAFSFFWTAAPLWLSGPQFGLTQSGIAWVALAGVPGAVAPPIAGRVADNGLSQQGTALATLLAASAFLLTNLAEPGSECCPCWDGPRRPRDSSCADLLLSAFGT